MPSNQIPNHLHESTILTLEQVLDSLQSTRLFLSDTEISRATVDGLIEEDFLQLFDLLQEIRSVNNDQWTYPEESQYRNHDPRTQLRQLRPGQANAYNNQAYLQDDPTPSDSTTAIQEDARTSSPN